MKTIRFALFFSSAALFLFACNTPPKQETVPQDNNDTFIDSAVSRSQDSMIIPNNYELKFKSGLEYKLQNLHTALDVVRNSSDVAKVYAQALSIQGDLNESISLQYKKEKIAKKDSLKSLFSNTCDTFAVKSKLFKFTYVADSTAPYFLISNDSLLRLSKRTKQKDDDAFFNLLTEIYGLEGVKDITFPKWIVQTTDYSGYMTLGDNTATKILTEIGAQRAKETQFKSQLASIYDDLIDAILTYRKYGKSKSQIIAELEKIVAGYNMITDEDNDRISQRIADLKTGIKDKQIEYNCEQGNCHYE